MTGPSWKPGGTPPVQPLPGDEKVTHRPAREGTGRRNGIPEGNYYTYRGGGDPDRDAQVADQLAAIRRQAARNRQQRLEEQHLEYTGRVLADICEAIDGPSGEWYRELAEELGLDLPGGAA